MSFAVSLPRVQIAIDRAWVDPIQKADLIAEVTALRTHMTLQTARVEPLITGSGRSAKNVKKTIYWFDFCSEEPVACTNECLPAVADSDDSAKDIELTGCREKKFAVSQKQFRDVPHEYQNYVGLKIAAKMKDLDEWLNKQFIAFVEANKGDQEFLDFPIGQDDAGDWAIPGNQWDVDLVPQLLLTARYAKFGRPYMLDGINLWAQILKAGFYGANGEGKGEALLWGQIPYVSDLVVPTVAPGKTYMINASAIAFVTGNFWNETRTEYAPGHYVYTIASRNLPGVFYDVHEITACLNDDFVTSFRIVPNYEFLLNPLGCNATRTGIISFEKVANVA